MKHPTLLTITADNAAHGIVDAAFSSVGWRILAVAPVNWRERLGTVTPALILHGAIDDPAAAPKAVRAHPATAAAPLIAWSPAPEADAAFDGWLARTASPDALVALAERWRPDDPGPGLERLGQVLGTAEIESLVRRLRSHLAAALGGMAAGDVPGEAHRIAGIAGMLGFDALGTAWLAVSHGEAGATARARVATRRALAALADR